MIEKMKNLPKNKDISVFDLNNALAKSGDDFQFVDVREFPEYSASHIEGIELIPLGDLEQKQGELDRSKPIVVICRSGNRAAKAKEKLQNSGFSDVRNVEGGMNAWKSAGYEVKKDENAVWDLERQVRFTAGLLVLAGVILSVFSSFYFIWLAGFIGAGLVFSAVTNTCGMGMVLARLPWNQAKNSCQTNEDGVISCN